jgi:hypothetical protein
MTTISVYSGEVVSRFAPIRRPECLSLGLFQGAVRSDRTCAPAPTSSRGRHYVIASAKSFDWLPNDPFVEVCGCTHIGTIHKLMLTGLTFVDVQRSSYPFEPFLMDRVVGLDPQSLKAGPTG